MAEADGAPCAHPLLGHLDPDRQRGWLCTECGESGPTVARVAEMGSKYGPVTGIQVLCICGSGMEWPVCALGAEVARYLAEHADCRERAHG